MTPSSEVGGVAPTVVYRTISQAGNYAPGEILQATPVTIAQTDTQAHAGQPQYATLQV